MNWGKGVSEPETGDIAAGTHSRYGGPVIPGKAGGHVTTYAGPDPDNTSRFLGTGGNQRTGRTASFPRNRYSFRRGDQAPGAPSRAAGPGAGSRQAAGPEDEVWSKGAPPVQHLEQLRMERQELERPIKMRFEKPPGESQFRRANIRREVNREHREAIHNSFSDIGGA